VRHGFLGRRVPGSGEAIDDGGAIQKIEIPADLDECVLRGKRGEILKIVLAPLLFCELGAVQVRIFQQVRIVLSREQYQLTQSVRLGFLPQAFERPGPVKE